ncbi:MAG: hypothetical protein U1F87_14555 [Kiritimatiellia bacterium]
MGPRPLIAAEARDEGLPARVSTFATPDEAGAGITLPMIALLGPFDDRGTGHYVVVTGFRNGKWVEFHSGTLPDQRLPWRIFMDRWAWTEYEGISSTHEDHPAHPRPSPCCLPILASTRLNQKPMSRTLMSGLIKPAPLSGRSRTVDLGATKTAAERIEPVKRIAPLNARRGTVERSTSNVGTAKKKKISIELNGD